MAVLIPNILNWRIFTQFQHLSGRATVCAVPASSRVILARLHRICTSANEPFPADCGSLPLLAHSWPINAPGWAAWSLSVARPPRECAATRSDLGYRRPRAARPPARCPCGGSCRRLNALTALDRRAVRRLVPSLTTPAGAGFAQAQPNSRCNALPKFQRKPSAGTPQRRRPTQALRSLWQRLRQGSVNQKRSLG